MSGPDFNLLHALHLLNNHDAVLLDVRTHDEFCTGHLKSALLVSTPLPPLSKRERENLKDELQYVLRNTRKDVPIVVYCKKGIRAKAAKQILEDLGYYVVILGGVELEPIKSIMTGENPVWPTCFCKK